MIMLDAKHGVKYHFHRKTFGRLVYTEWQMPTKKKNPHAAAMGKKGGKARARALSPEQRKMIAKSGAQARWAKKEP